MPEISLRTSLRSVPTSARPLAVAAAGAVVAFRSGVLPGGHLGYDVLFALAGAWCVERLLAERRVPSIRQVAGEALGLAWPGAVATLVLAVGWVLATSSTAMDRVVRGEALAVVGGYGNWHQISAGPSEALAAPVASPLQGVWPWGMLVQVGVAWAIVWTLCLAWARRRTRLGLPGRPLALLVGAGAVVVVLQVVVSLAVVLAGVGSATQGLATPNRSLAFSLGVLVAVATRRTPDGAALVAVRRLAPLAGAGLVVLALVGRPGGTVADHGGYLLAALAAGVLVAGLVDGWSSDRSSPLPAGWLVALLWVVGPAAALARSESLGLPWPAAVVLGVVLAGAVAVAVAWLAELRSAAPAALERRRVLVPPLVLGLVVVVLSVTGAFHWTGPERLSAPAAVRTGADAGPA